MSHRWKMLVLGAAVALVELVSAKAQAATLNINVAIGGAVSVQVNGNPSTTTYATWQSGSREMVAQSTVDVQNNSGGRSENWQLQTSQYSTDQGSAGSWSIRVSTSLSDIGLDQFALEAAFVSSKAAITDCGLINWHDAQSTMTVVGYLSAQSYGSGTYLDRFVSANENVGTIGGTPYADKKTTGVMYSFNGTTGIGHRGLCWNVIGPATVSGNDNQLIVLTITAL